MKRAYVEFKDLYGKTIRVQRSSLAFKDAVWIQNEITKCDDTFLANAHLDKPMARKIIKALERFVRGEE